MPRAADGKLPQRAGRARGCDKTAVRYAGWSRRLTSAGLFNVAPSRAMNLIVDVADQKRALILFEGIERLLRFCKVLGGRFHIKFRILNVVQYFFFSRRVGAFSKFFFERVNAASAVLDGLLCG